MLSLTLKPRKVDPRIPWLCTCILTYGVAFKITPQKKLFSEKTNQNQTSKLEQTRQPTGSSKAVVCFNKQYSHVPPLHHM